MNATETDEEAGAERHASWAELFFDLVAVAGVAALAHLLGSELDASSLGLYALLYLTFWLSWTTFMLYSNVAAGGTRVVRLLIGMFGIGVMAASVPGVAHSVLDGDHHNLAPNVFAIAYMATRVYGSQSWRRGVILLDFPVVQYSFGLLPWIVSIWIDEPWKLTLWAVGVGLDLILVLVVSGSTLLQQFQAKLSQQKDFRQQRRGGGRPEKRDALLQGVSVDPDLLASGSDCS